MIILALVALSSLDFCLSVKSATLYGPISNTQPDYLDRDSCGSTRWNNRALLVCRDTQIYKNLGNRKDGIKAFYSSSASYIDINQNGSLPFVPFTAEPGTPPSQSNFKYRLPAYGNNNNNRAFYPETPNECDANTGSCTNNSTRWVIWPDSPPMISTSLSDGSIIAYTWIKKAYITYTFSSLITFPATSLYRLNYSPAIHGIGDTLPTVSLVKENLFQEGHFPYGSFGNIVKDGIAYLFGSTQNGETSLAKVPIGSEEILEKYQYYVNNEWTKEIPRVGDKTAWIKATAGGQGTFYWSEPWKSFVWIGQSIYDASLTLWITTAQEITGPWSTPKKFFDKPNQPGFVYSVQAHPAFLAHPMENSVWVSYTIAINDYGYDTKLYKFDWQ